MKFRLVVCAVLLTMAMVSARDVGVGITSRGGLARLMLDKSTGVDIELEFRFDSNREFFAVGGYYFAQPYKEGRYSVHPVAGLRIGYDNQFFLNPKVGLKPGMELTNRFLLESFLGLEFLYAFETDYWRVGPTTNFLGSTALIFMF